MGRRTIRDEIARILVLVLVLSFPAVHHAHHARLTRPGARNIVERVAKHGHREVASLTTGPESIYWNLHQRTQFYLKALDIECSDVEPIECCFSSRAFRPSTYLMTKASKLAIKIKVPTTVNSGCIQIQNAISVNKQGCSLPPYCGTTVYSEVRSNWWSTTGVCYGIGDDPSLAGDGQTTNNEWFDAWYVSITASDGNETVVFPGQLADTMIWGESSTHYMLLPGYFGAYLATMNNSKTLPPDLKETDDGKFCVPRPVDNYELSQRLVPRKDVKGNRIKAVTKIINKYPVPLCYTTCPNAKHRGLVFTDHDDGYVIAPQCQVVMPQVTSKKPAVAKRAIWQRIPIREICDASYQTTGFLKFAFNSVLYVIGQVVLIVLRMLFDVAGRIVAGATEYYLELDDDFNLTIIVITVVGLCYKLRSLWASIFITLAVKLLIMVYIFQMRPTGVPHNMRPEKYEEDYVNPFLELN